jgi:hypothetical protein
MALARRIRKSFGKLLSRGFAAIVVGIDILSFKGDQISGLRDDFHNECESIHNKFDMPKFTG